MFLSAGVVAGAFNDKGSFSAVEVHGAGAQASALPEVAAPSGLTQKMIQNKENNRHKMNSSTELSCFYLKSVITGLVQVIQ